VGVDRHVPETKIQLAKPEPAGDERVLPAGIDQKITRDTPGFTPSIALTQRAHDRFGLLLEVCYLHAGAHLRSLASRMVE
jgi:hypothetical protein